MKLNDLPAYVRTPEDIANNAAEDAWKERRREQDRRMLVSRVEQERREAVRRCVDAWAARTTTAN